MTIYENRYRAVDAIRRAASEMADAAMWMYEVIDDERKAGEAAHLMGGFSQALHSLAELVADLP